MREDIRIGEAISTDNVPNVFWQWYTDKCKEYDLCTMEVKNGEIQVVRAKTVVNGPKAVEHLKYGKITSDSSGEFLEKTFIPRYSRERNEIILEQ